MRKLKCLGEIRSFIKRLSYIFIENICSKILQKLLVKEIGLLFKGLCLLPFLCLGTTYEIFPYFGTEEVVKEQLKISDTGRIIELIVRLIKNEGILSQVFLFYYLF